MKDYFDTPCYKCDFEDNNVVLTPGVDEGYTKCQGCQAIIYITLCQNCKENFAYDFDDKTLLPDKSWKCEKCKHTNHLNEKNYQNFMESVSFESLPSELTKKVRDMAKIGKIVFVGILIYVLVIPLLSAVVKLVRGLAKL